MLLQWTDKNASIAEQLRYRRLAGYTLRADLSYLWQRHLVWWVLAAIPREVKYWTVIQVAAKFGTGPDEITASMMLKELEK